MIFPVGPKSGVENVKKVSKPKGMADQRIQGRNCPQRVCVLSAIIPISGSFTASHNLETRKSVATTPAEKAEYVGVKKAEKNHNGSVGQVGRGIAQSVSDFFLYRKFLHWRSFRYNRCRERVLFLRVGIQENIVKDTKNEFKKLWLSKV